MMPVVARRRRTTLVDALPEEEEEALRMREVKPRTPTHQPAKRRETTNKEVIRALN